MMKKTSKGNDNATPVKNMRLMRYLKADKYDNYITIKL